MVKLIIEGVEIELSDDIQYALNREFEELSNPTIIITEWSKTVSIPFTAKNNITFGHIYCPDKMIVDGGSVGIYFSPLKKLDFRLEWNGAVLMFGYAKMNEVTTEKGNGKYKITLFGQLGKVFQEMEKITFDVTSPNTEYIIDGSQYVSETITRNLVLQSWTSSGQTTPQLLKVTDSGYVFTDIFGFAPNNAFTSNFNHKGVQQGTTYSNTFENILGSTFTTQTGIEPSIAIPDGLLPREYGEFRSYMQIPWIWWNKLFKIFQEKAEEVTGYEFDLDADWFNTKNPYWYNLVYIINGLTYGEHEEALNRYSLAFNNGSIARPNIYWGSADYSYQYGTGYIEPTYHDEGASGVFIGNRVYDIDEEVPMWEQYGDRHWATGNWGVHINTTFSLGIRYLEFYDDSYKETKLGPSNALRLYFRVKELDSNTTLSEWSVLIKASNYTGNTPSTNAVVNCDTVSTSQQESDGRRYSRIPFNVPVSLYIPPATKAYITIGGGWVGAGNMVPFVKTDGGSTSGTDPIYLPLIYLYNTAGWKDFDLTTEKRSYSTFVLSDLWDNDYNLFREILRYCKMYRIGIKIDEFNKKIEFKPISKYFSTYKVRDWTSKIDASKETTIITPVTFQNKYVLFNSDDTDVKIGKDYNEKFGVNYGDYRLVTDYNFNIETKELFKGVKPSIVSTDYALTWPNLNANKIVYSLPSEILLANKDEDKKEVNLFGTFFFHNGLRSFDTEAKLAMPTVKISDDTSLQQATSTYFYTALEGTKTQCNTYPALDIVRGSNLCTFTTPKQNYTYLKNYDGKYGIYQNFWEDYINERYNIQNKQITCHANIKPMDYCRFFWNDFVRYGNQLCMINKIYDYDITDENTTKVDLITIQDIGGYQNNAFFVRVDDLVTHFYDTNYLSGIIMENPSQLGWFETFTDVTFANGLKTYTTHNVKFTISGDAVYYQSLTKYVDKTDDDFTITIKNAHHSADIHCVRYSVYPYPEIKLYESDGTTERSTIYPGTRNYKLAWYGTETYGLENKPTVTIEVHGTGSAVIDASTWVENQVVIQEGDDEWFREEYVVNFNTNMTNYSGSYVRVTITDVEGWHDTRDFPVSI